MSDKNTLVITPIVYDTVMKAVANKFFPHFADEYGVAIVEDLIRLSKKQLVFKSSKVPFKINMKKCKWKPKKKAKLI